VWEHGKRNHDSQCLAVSFTKIPVSVLLLQHGPGTILVEGGCRVSRRSQRTSNATDGAPTISLAVPIQRHALHPAGPDIRETEGNKYIGSFSLSSNEYQMVACMTLVFKP